MSHICNYSSIFHFVHEWSCQDVSVSSASDEHINLSKIPLLIQLLEIKEDYLKIESLLKNLIYQTCRDDFFNSDNAEAIHA